MAWHRFAPVKCAPSAFAGAMNRHTSSSPSGVSQPARRAALHGKAVRRLLVGTAELVAAFVRVDPQLHVPVP